MTADIRDQHVEADTVIDQLLALRGEAIAAVSGRAIRGPVGSSTTDAIVKLAAKATPADVAAALRAPAGEHELYGVADFARLLFAVRAGAVFVEVPADVLYGIDPHLFARVLDGLTIELRRRPGGDVFFETLAAIALDPAPPPLTFAQLVDTAQRLSERVGRG